MVPSLHASAKLPLSVVTSELVDESSQSLCVGISPTVRRYEAGPTLDVLRRVVVSETRRHVELVEGIAYRLQARDNRKPTHGVRHVEAAGTSEPFRWPPQHLRIPEDSRIGGMLKVNDPRSGPVS